MSNEIPHRIPVDLISKYLANEATAAERSELEQWLAGSKDNRHEFDAFKKLWIESENVKEMPDIDLSKEWQRMDRVISGDTRKVFTIRRVLQIAASIVVLIGLSLFTYQQLNTVSIKTDLAQQRVINLPDGSRVTLNANTKLAYSKSFGKTDRDISLKGEAFFEVAKNADLPFVIEANKAAIKVVGTKFNVKAYKKSDDIEVAVVEGVVQLYETKQPEKRTVLTAGETGIYMKEKEAIKKLSHLNPNSISWKTKKIVFENSSLKYVFMVLSNTYNVEFTVSEPVEDCKISVSFDQSDLSSILKVLKSTLHLTYTKKGAAVVVEGTGCDKN